MHDSNDSVETINGVPVVAASAEIDVTTAEQLRSVLLDGQPGACDGRGGYDPHLVL